MRRALSLCLMALASAFGLPCADAAAPPPADLHKLFNALDATQPRMAAIQRHWQAGNPDLALTALLAHFALKPSPLNAFEPLPWFEHPVAQAEAILRNEFFVIDRAVPVPTGPDGMPNWNWRGPRDDKEWAWMFNRMNFLNPLAIAYAETGDERFSQHLDALWLDWIASNPYPEGLSFSPQWRALEVARRMLSAWIHSFYRLQASPSFSPQTRLRVLASILDHADALRNHASFWGGNHLITEKVALLAIAHAFPEFAAAAEWKAYAIERISEEILAQTYPDGAFMELSNHYQRVILLNSLQFARILAASEKDPRSLPVFQRIEQMWALFAFSARPDGIGPLNNAGDQEQNFTFVRLAEPLFERADWLFVTSGGQRGSPPAVASTVFPFAGQAFLRRDWSPQSPWAYFDAGPYGSAHQHTDRLHVSFYAKGQPILVDNGRYTYQPGPWASYFKGPFAHNVLIVNGHAAVQAPRTVDAPLRLLFDPAPNFPQATANAVFHSPLHQLSGPVHWQRSVQLDTEKSILTVTDSVTAFQSSTLTFIWNFHPSLSLEAAEAAITPDPQNPTPSAVEVFYGRTAPTPAGFHSHDYNHRQPSPQHRYHFVIDRPSTFIWHFHFPFNATPN